MPQEQMSASNPPLIGRVFEVRAAEERVVTAKLRGNSENSMQLETGPSTMAAQTARAAAPEEAILPFLGPVLNYVPGSTITVERRLNLEEDLYLADHAFVYAPGVIPLSACLPVLPMTMSLEAMAEVAACLVPGHGLLGFEDIKAARWIELADTDSLTLHITATVDRHDAERGTYFLKVTISIEGKAFPAISGIVLFGNRYLVEVSLTFTELSNAYRHPLTIEQIYRERHMFHGPRLRCLAGEIIVGDEGLAGEFAVRSPDDLFSSTRRPQLLMDPALLDAVGQIIGIWAMEHDLYVFPIGLTKLEIYCPTPPVGTRVPVRVEITRDEGKRLLANVEVQNGAGGVWMRIADWGSWKFRWKQRLVDFRRLPHQYLLGQPAPLPELDKGPVCLMLTASELENFDFGMLARHCLSMEEMPVFQGYARVPQRQQQWLLGRIVAKDAVRCWAAAHTQAAMLHPAAFTIESDVHGRPFVRTLPGCDTPPLLSIAHCEARAIAVAHGQATGVDIERIAPRDANFVQTFTTAPERYMTVDFPEAERHAWSTRLWCAKEAAGKLLGKGVDGAPQAFEAVKVESGGEIHIRHQASASSIRVKTVEDLGFIIAYASKARALADHVS
jgi:phosphopantetheinyl transferase